ncbi:MAG: PAS domain-containing protein [Planctomycetes bacterium]|nr:PAS domain-containing protein [Planctomycetota bacterium]
MDDFHLEHYLFRLISRGDYARAMESLVENIDLDIFVINQEGVIYIWNRSLEDAVCPRHEAIGRHFWEVFPGFTEEFQGKVWGDRVMVEVLEEGRVVEQSRYPQKTRDGQIRIYDLKAFPLALDEKRWGGAVVVRHDVTDRIQLEEQLVRTARTSSLAQLGASIAHEIRNPLNSISLNLQLITELVTGPGEVPRQELVETAKLVKSEIDRLNRIIKDFLQFARSPQTRARPESVPELLEYSSRLLGEEARRSGVRIVLEVDHDLPPVEIDRDQISQALYNLMLNSIQEMPGGGTLVAGARRGRDFLSLYVRDTGPGIAAEEKDRLFDLFYSTKEGGTGLGLAIAHRIVEGHKGRIVAENHPEGGALFTIYLPLSPIREPEGKR